MIRQFKNDYDVNMLEITGGKRSVYISLNKALAILETGYTNGLIKEVKAHGRNLFEITKLTGGKFKVGATKVNAVLEHIEELNELRGGSNE